MPDFTPTQGRYLAYILAYTEGFGLPPAEAEIAKAIGVSPPSVNQMMKTLEKKGLIRRQPGVARSIEILVDSTSIPAWKGKRITRSVREWTRIAPAVRADRITEKVLYRLKITLQGSVPLIWRRIETLDVSLLALHELIQTAMGWTNSHLHQFEIDGIFYTAPRFMDGDFGAVDYSGIRLSGLVSEHGENLKLRYQYDFGDCWEHDIALETVGKTQPGERYSLCTGGDRACPPEDVGGVHGFADYVQAITNPDHEEYEDYLEWNGPYDPAAFDTSRATRRMRKGLPKW